MVELFAILIVIASISLLRDLLGWKRSSLTKVETCPHCQSEGQAANSNATYCSACGLSLHAHPKNLKKTTFFIPRLTLEMRLVVELFAKITKSDGVVTKNEIQVVDRLLKSTYHPSKDQLNELRRLFNEAKKTPMGYEALLHKLDQVLSPSEAKRLALIEQLFQIGLADHPLDERQQAVIAFATTALHVSIPYQTLRRRFISDISEHYVVLGCSEQDSIETIKKNYRRLIKENHPDQFAHRPDASDIIQLANQKIKEIHDAYESITKAKRASQV